MLITHFTNSLLHFYFIIKSSQYIQLTQLVSVTVYLLPHNLSHVSLDCGGNVQRHHYRQKLVSCGFKPRTFLLWNELYYLK